MCAIATQRSFAADCESHPDQPLRIRMGLHVGEAINESADYFGKAVILAARIAALAQGGQILVSSTFHDLTASAGDLHFASIGDKQLKGLAGIVQYIRGVLVGAGGVTMVERRSEAVIVGVPPHPEVRHSASSLFGVG